jgi:hypothetical protein
MKKGGSFDCRLFFLPVAEILFRGAGTFLCEPGLRA